MTSSPATPIHQRLLVHWVIIALLTGAVFANALPNAFHLDDFYRVSGNPEIQRFWPPWRHFVDPGTSSTLPRITQFRPLLPLSLSIDHALFGGGVVGFHLTALLIHLLSALLVYAVVRRLLVRTGDKGVQIAPRINAPGSMTALVTALLFAIHPISANPVNYIAARDLLLMLCFLLASLRCYLAFVDAGSWRGRCGWYVCALFCFALSLLAKTNAVALPLLLLALEWLVLRRPSGSLSALLSPRLWLRIIPFFALAFGFFAYTRWGLAFSDLAQVSPDAQQSWAGYALGQTKVHLVYYLRSVVWPFAMHQDPRVQPATGLGDPGVIFGAVVMLSSLVIAFRWRQRHPLLAFAILAYWILLAPTSSVIPMRRAVVDYRPYPGLAWLMLTLVLAGTALITHTKARAIAATAAIVYCGLSTVWFNTVWRNERTLWHHAVTHGAGALAHHNLAMSERDIQRRVQYLERAIEISPNYTLAYLNLGRAQVVLGNVDQGLANCRQAVMMQPNWAQLHFWYGRTLAEVGRDDEALLAYVQAAMRDPRNIEYQYQAARASIAAGQAAMAEPFLRRVREQDASYKDTQALDVQLRQLQ